MSFKEAATWSVVWVALALALPASASTTTCSTRFAERAAAYAPSRASIPARLARQAALEFLAGYVVEYSLSVDNIFVFVVVLGYFAMPTAAASTACLFFGILGALDVPRRSSSRSGAALLQLTSGSSGSSGSSWSYTGFRMMFTEDKEVQPEENAIIRLFRRFVPVTRQHARATSFFVRVDGVPATRRRCSSPCCSWR